MEVVDLPVPAPPREVERRLAEHYPQSRSALNYSDAFQLLVVTVLSAQTTDARVNLVSPILFREFPDAVALAGAPLEKVEEILHPLGMFRRRAEQVTRLAQDLLADFGGAVPSTREELMRLPGVGRKTANVVLGNWFDLEEITVDTHVGRVSRRLGWTRERNPLKVEEDLRELLPDAPWTKLCHQLIDHGRAICRARVPGCEECFLVDICPRDFDA